ncbi:MAG: HlyD family efflux transporter periplasmic adaptor subunit [Gemmataceae bacterium]|nr:HlyD family efflux transporter periplasmic adaptor subunit [Gemmataceae bacterium]
MKKLLLVLIVVGLGLAGVAYVLNQPGIRPATPDIFTYAQVMRGPMVESISATGLLQPREVFVVSSELPGTVIEVRARVNDLVSEGDVLLRLDDRKHQLKLEEATGGLATAEAALAQVESLREAAQLAVKYQRDIQSSGGFRSALDEAEAKLRAAIAGVRVAQAKVEHARTLQKEAQLARDLTMVRVPTAQGSSGDPKRQYLVLEKKVQRGQLVGPPAGLPLFTLAGDLNNMEVHAEVAEGDIGKVRKGLTVEFTVASYWDPEVKFRGVVKEIRPLPTNVKGAIFYSTVIEVANRKDPRTDEWMLRPGMTAAVDVIIRSRAKVWKVPGSALNFQMEEAYQTEAAQARVKEWRQRSDADEWRPIWVWDEARKSPWPVFVRVGGLKGGEPGMKDGDYNEILQWEEGAEPATGGPGPRVIIDAPPARRPGLFDQPTNIKLS